jgi:hypothetical protein
MSSLLRLNDKTAKTVPGATDQMLLWDTATETYSTHQCLLEVVQLFPTTPFPPKSLLKTVAIPLIHVLFTLMELSPRSPNIDLVTD